MRFRELTPRAAYVYAVQWNVLGSEWAPCVAGSRPIAREKRIIRFEYLYDCVTRVFRYYPAPCVLKNLKLFYKKKESNRRDRTWDLDCGNY